MTLQLLANRLYTLTNCVLVAAILLKNVWATHLQPWQHRWIDRAVLLVHRSLLPVLRSRVRRLNYRGSNDYRHIGGNSIPPGRIAWSR